MQKKLFISYIIISLFAFGVSLLLFWSKGFSYIHAQGEKSNLIQTQILGDVFETIKPVDTNSYDDFAEKYAKKYKIRITIIGADGVVVADSESDFGLENHATREEVVSALKGESISINRFSKTMNRYYSYSAVPISQGDFHGVLRVSMPLSDLNALGKELISFVLLIALLCFLVAMGIAIIFTRKIGNPIDDITKAAEKISEGDYGIKIYTRDKTQIGRLAAAFNTMAIRLNTSMNKLTRRNIELEAMLSSMNSGVVAIDTGSTILFHNEAFADMICAQSKDLIRKPLYEEIRNALLFEVIDSVKESGKDVIREGHLITDGSCSDIFVRISATPLMDHKEISLGYLLIIEDITQMKKLETMRSDFVSNVTHELKTPLTSIRGFIDTLKGGAMKDEKVARKFLDIIDIESERLYSLIQDILLLSEIESKRDYELVMYDVKTCVQAVIELLEGKTSEDVTIIYKPEAYIRPYNCNLDRMKELMINLLDNALKYTEKGTITVECKEVENELVFRVSDTGIGMEEEHLSRIFERFYRVDRGRSRKQGGTGLGLSIVKHIVELYGGRIIVESKLNEGTVFEIRLPY